MVQFASYLRRVLCKTWLIFPRINGPIVFIYFRWVPPWHFLHLCDPIETFDITSPPTPVQWRPQLQYSDTGGTTNLDPKSVCTVLVSDTFAYRSVPINKLEDALTYPRVKSICQLKNLLFQADFIACNLSFPPIFFFFRPEFEDVLMMIFDHTFFVMPINLPLVLQFGPILSTQTQTIYSVLFSSRKIRQSAY